MNWLYYVAEANLYLCLFYLAYCLFLNRLTHYTLSRVYLLFSCVISFILPTLQLGFLKPLPPQSTTFIQTEYPASTPVAEPIPVKIATLTPMPAQPVIV